MIRNGGRNGVALSLGFRWALGKEDSGKISNRTPELKPAKVVIKNNK